LYFILGDKYEQFLQELAHIFSTEVIRGSNPEPEIPTRSENIGKSFSKLCFDFFAIDEKCGHLQTFCKIDTSDYAHHYNFFDTAIEMQRFLLTQSLYKWGYVEARLKTLKVIP